MEPVIFSDLNHKEDVNIGPIRRETKKVQEFSINSFNSSIEESHMEAHGQNHLETGRVSRARKSTKGAIMDLSQ